MKDPSSPPVEWFAEGIVDRERKLDGYLLSPTHHRGRHKARLWQSVFGVEEGDGELLERLIREQLVGTAGVSPEEREPVATREDPPGMVSRWEVVIPHFLGPNGNRGPVLTAWALEPGAHRPHLTNAYPVVRRTR